MEYKDNINNYSNLNYKNFPNFIVSSIKTTKNNLVKLTQINYINELSIYIKDNYKYDSLNQMCIYNLISYKVSSSENKIYLNFEISINYKFHSNNNSNIHLLLEYNIIKKIQDINNNLCFSYNSIVLSKPTIYDLNLLNTSIYNKDRIKLITSNKTCCFLLSYNGSLFCFGNDEPYKTGLLAMGNSIFIVNKPTLNNNFGTKLSYISISEKHAIATSGKIFKY